MAHQVFPPNVIVKILCNDFLEYRNLTMSTRGLDPEIEIPNYNSDRVISDMAQFYYVRIDAVRKIPRGRRDWVVIIILSADGKYSQHSPDLRKLLEGIEADRLSKDGRLDEIIVIAEETFFGKKNLTDVIREIQRKQVKGPDFDGESLFCNAYSYDKFSLVVPKHKSVALHRIMSKKETEDLFKREHITRNDLAIIFTTDSQIIWIGGREEQIVEITRDSQTAGTSIYYRRIELGSIA